MEIFDFLKYLHNECIRLSQPISFDKKHLRHLYLVCLYGTLIELVGSLIVLIESKRKRGVPVIFRSLLEAYIDLINLHEKAEYGYNMDASNHEQWIKVLKEAKYKPSNQYLKDISKINNLDEQIQEYEKELANLKKRGYSSLNIFQRFERAGMEDEYRSLYNSLSNDAHSNIRALIDHHLEIHENDFNVVYYKDEPLKEFLVYIDSAVGPLINASLKIHSYFKTGSIAEIEKMAKRVNEIRNRYKF